MKKIILGIDEAGRGPWAGPLVVGGVAVLDDDFLSEIPELTDSKKISEKSREKIFARLLEAEKFAKIQIFTEFQSAEIIDKIWIRKANELAMQNIIKNFLFQNKEFLQKNCFEIKIDWSDNFVFDEKIFADFPDFKYIFAVKKSRKKISENIDSYEQKSIELTEGMWRNCEENFCKFFIGWDLSEKEISAASIIAKVSRDTYMKRISWDFPEYNFAKNKWYGTRAHHEAILNYGIKNEHRKTFEPIKTLISRDFSIY